MFSSLYRSQARFAIALLTGRSDCTIVSAMCSCVSLPECACAVGLLMAAASLRRSSGGTG
ncbi:hypothetical protein TPCCA_0109a [Treponema paraluiscuniculi Cuniculi A]|uniref:Uncharacterized protein n=2 Tax=Treponema paraluiscuniculi TaxID=53435 RepID=F7XRV0_TREPU|nr:hypothetical protein TPCCA_0109a [Treponema paraluiscuniculi Cuniculi A]WKC71998.1 hypothetical protein TPLL2_0109a [Treponema paraluiscuniculi]